MAAFNGLYVLDSLNSPWPKDLWTQLRQTRTCAAVVAGVDGKTSTFDTIRSLWTTLLQVLEVGSGDTAKLYLNQVDRCAESLR